MILPWLIGQAFVRVGPGAMMALIFAALLLNVVILWSFTRVSAKQTLVEHRAIAD
jgi:hypothetical protein